MQWFRHGSYFLSRYRPLRNMVPKAAKEAVRRMGIPESQRDPGIRALGLESVSVLERILV